MNAQMYKYMEYAITHTCDQFIGKNKKYLTIQLMCSKMPIVSIPHSID